MTLRKLLLLATATAPFLQAHPGHEPFSEGASHFISSPNHFTIPLLFSLLVIAAASLLRRRRERLFLRALAAVIAALAVFS